MQTTNAQTACVLPCLKKNGFHRGGYPTASCEQTLSECELATSDYISEGLEFVAKPWAENKGMLLIYAHSRAMWHYLKAGWQGKLNSSLL